MFFINKDKISEIILGAETYLSENYNESAPTPPAKNDSQIRYSIKYSISEDDGILYSLKDIAPPINS